MPKPANRIQLMRRLGAEQINHVWAWCAANHADKKVYFSVWADNILKGSDGKPRYLIDREEPDHRFADRSPARNDRDEKLQLVFDKGYEAFAYFIEAKDPKSERREIKATRTSFVMKVELERLGNGDLIGTPIKRIEVT